MTVLVAYASKHGATAEIAQAIAGTLRGSGSDVECMDAGDVASVEPYDAVVLGSAVYMKRWRGDATRFLRTHGDGLSRRPFWVFSSGPVGDPANDDPAWMEPRKVLDRIERLGARGHAVFGGRVPSGAGGPFDRAMAKNTPAEFRDRRDWDRIREWAEGIASELEGRLPRRPEPRSGTPTGQIAGEPSDPTADGPVLQVRRDTPHGLYGERVLLTDGARLVLRAVETRDVGRTEDPRQQRHRAARGR